MFVLTDFLSIYSPRAGFLVFKKGCQRNPPGRSPMRIQGTEPCLGEWIFHDGADISPHDGVDVSPLRGSSVKRCPRHLGERCPRHLGNSIDRDMGLWLGFAWMGRSGGLRWHSFLFYLDECHILSSVYSSFWKMVT